MSKDYAKKSYSTTQKSNSDRWHVALAFAVLIIILIGGVALWAHQTQSGKLAKENMVTWFNNKIKRPTTTTKTVVQPVQADDDIHFDFYTALPKMQVTL